MKTAPGFQIDHTILKKGIYISSIDEDITVFDIRMRDPNRETVMTNAAIHTIEHLFKDRMNDSEFSDNIICFAPKGSRTGFTFVVRSLSDNYCINFIRDTFKYVGDYWGVVPGASPKECGNCVDHNLPQAKEEARAFLKVIENWSKDDLKYPVKEDE